MAKYIDSEKAIDACFNGWNNNAHDCAENIRSIPAADVVERKTGRWCADYDYAEYDFDGSTPLPEPQKFQDGWQCSLCGVYSLSETNYCPNCGADMRGEQNGH